VRTAFTVRDRPTQGVAHGGELPVSHTDAGTDIAHQACCMTPSSQVRRSVEISSAENAIRIRVEMDHIQWLLGYDENSPRSVVARHLAPDTQEG
jgi:hypothetical protein